MAKTSGKEEAPRSESRRSFVKNVSKAAAGLGLLSVNVLVPSPYEGMSTENVFNQIWAKYIPEVEQALNKE